MMTATPAPAPGPSARIGFRFAQLPDPLSRHVSNGAYRLAGIIDDFRRRGIPDPTSGELAREMGLSPGQVDRYLSELRETRLPGQDVPVLVTRRERGRRVLVLTYRLLGSASRPSPEVHAFSAGAACNQRRRGIGADFPPYREFTKRENVNVASLTGESPPAREDRDDSKPIVPEPAPPGPSPPTQSPAREDPTSDGIVTRLNALDGEALDRRIAELTGSRRAGDIEELFLARALRAERRAANESAPAPTPTAPGAFTPPKPQPDAPRPAVRTEATPRHVETVDLIGKLATPAGPSMVETIVQRLCQKLDPAFEPCFRKACADVLAKRLDVRIVQGAWKSCQTATKPAAAFGAAIKKAREAQRARQVGNAPASARRE